MSSPWLELAEALEPGPTDPEATIYPAWGEANMVVPAIVLQPDEPWMEPHAFGIDQERYVAIAAVPGSAGREAGVADLHRLVHYIIRQASTIHGVAYETASAPVVDESTGTPLLAARVRLTYRACGDDSPS